MEKRKAESFAGVDTKEAEKAAPRTRFLPVAQYTGGAEHAVLHLLYTRFIWKFLVARGYISNNADLDQAEPFPKFFAHGLIIKDGAKMSKSKGNVVVPDAYIKKFGADTLRTYLMFLGPFSEGGDFRDSGIEGMYRFLKRVWAMGTGKNITSTPLSVTANRQLHKAIKGVTEDLSAFRYNTAIAKMMTLYNAFAQEKEVNREAFKNFLQLLAPFAPHMTEELWELHGGKYSIHTSAWPSFDERALVEETAIIVIQINGKMRGSLTVSKDTIDDQKSIEEQARALEVVQKHLDGKQIKKIIYVRSKILNYVAS
jgi:leucyl-tRNA synthetase